MAVRIVAKYDNAPIFIETIAADAQTIDHNGTITDTDVSDNQFIWECSDEFNSGSDMWCYPLASVGTPLLLANYAFPVLAKSGVWDFTILVTRNTAQTPLDTETCYPRGSMGFSFANVLDSGLSPLSPIYFYEQAAGPFTTPCDYGDTGYEFNFQGYFEIAASGVCQCGSSFLPYLLVTREYNHDSWDIAFSGEWVSDFWP